MEIEIKNITNVLPGERILWVKYMVEERGKKKGDIPTGTTYIYIHIHMMTYWKRQTYTTVSNLVISTKLMVARFHLIVGTI